MHNGAPKIQKLLSGIGFNMEFILLLAYGHGNHHILLFRRDLLGHPVLLLASPLCFPYDNYRYSI
jgi:hypothetical protein